MAKKYFDSMPIVDAKALNDSLGNAVNIEHYGAVGDGTTVNTTAIQAALDAVNTAGGGTVLVPIGVFLTDTLTMYSNITIRGTNRNKSIIKGIDAITGASIFECIGTAQAYKTGITFENLTIKHINTLSTGEKRLINALYTSYCVVRDCNFTEFSYSAIVISKTESTTKSWLIRNNIFNNGRAAGSRGVTLLEGGEYVSIIGNLFEHIAYGVYIDDAANTLISDNQITYAATGIFISHTTSGVNNGKTQIVNNQINHCGSHGIHGSIIRAAADRGMVIVGNQLLFNYSSGITLAGAYATVISANRISMSNGTDKGISITDYGTTQLGGYNIITSNIVTVGIISDISTGGGSVAADNIAEIP